MPTSHPGQISTILSIITRTNARTFLDIGPGCGKWGMLTREYVDISDGREKYHKPDWNCTIDAIEAFPQYITPAHRYWYDTIHEGNALEIVPTMSRRYDLALLIDVLEHFTKADGSALLRALLERCDGVLISAPKDNGDQGAAFGNQFETHRHRWTRGELAKFGPSFSVGDNRSTIVYVGRNARKIHVRRVLGRFPALEQVMLRAVARRHERKAS